MGVADRDYYRDQPAYGRRSASGGSVRLSSVNTWLIAINVVAFVLNGFLQVRVAGGTAGLLTLCGYFSFDSAIRDLQLWRFLSFQFLHADLGHVFFNMLGLYFFGPLVESVLGGRRYLLFYLACGIAGPMAYLLIMVLGLLPMNPYTPMIGASAGLFGVVIAAAFLAPDRRVQMLFPPIDMPLRTLAWIYVAIAAFVVLTRGANAGGEAGHLGGAAAGLLLIRNIRLLSIVDRLPSLGTALRRRLPKRGGSQMKYHGWR